MDEKKNFIKINMKQNEKNNVIFLENDKGTDYL
jgi:hypothetical protein